MRFGCCLTVAVLLFVTVVEASVSSAAESWAAVVVCPNCKRISWANNYSNPESAKRAAYDRAYSTCSTADLLCVTTKPYIVIARSSGGGYGWSTGDTPDQALAKATKNCLKYASNVSRFTTIQNGR